MRRLVLILFCLILSSNILVAACSNSGENPVNTSSIVTGEQVEAASAVMEARGGTIIINEPGSPINGLEIQVSPGAYSREVNFDIAYNPVESHILGDEILSVSPVISIENGSVYAEEPLMVTVPASIPENHFAMAFYFDEATGNLEGIPSFSSDGESVTLVTTHFSLFTLFSIEKDNLIKLDIDTGFTVGEDDWNLLNAGSYIGPGGYCSGMNLSSIWYYVREKPATGEPLWGQNDGGAETGNPTPDFWLDDWWAIRLCAAVQDQCYMFQQMPWDTFLWENYNINLTNSVNRTTFYSLAFSLYVSEKLHQDDPDRVISPQILGVWSEDAGHSLVCYKIKNNVVYIADPNIPGALNPFTPNIVYDDKNGIEDGTFTSYSSAANSRDFNNGHYTLYTKIRFRGVGSFASMQKIDDMWTTAENGRCMNEPDGRCFPDYSIYIESNDDAGKMVRAKLDLEQGANVTSDTIDLFLEWPGLAFLDIYDLDAVESYQKEKEAENRKLESGENIPEEEKVKFPSSLDLSRFRLSEGDNFLGICVMAVNEEYEAQQSKADSNGEVVLSWAGFDWVNIYYEPVEQTATQTQKAPPILKITNPASGSIFTEDEEIILTIEAFDGSGNPLPEKFINNNIRWIYDDGKILGCSPLSKGDFVVYTDLSAGTHQITVSIIYDHLETVDSIDINIVPETFTLRETLLKKEWLLYFGDNPTSNWIKFYEDGSFHFRNDSWKATWALDGSSIDMEMSFDYKSGPDMIQHVRLTGTITASPDGYYYNATMHGEYEEWCDWDKEGTWKGGMWRAE